MAIPILHSASESEVDHIAGGLLWGVAPEHVPALIAVLVIPIVVWMYIGWKRSAAAAGRLRPRRFVADLDAAPMTTKTAAVLLLVSAAIHAALIPHHLGDGSGIAFFFALDVLALGFVARRAVVGRRWRGLAIWLLSANLTAYFGYTIAGVEHLDEVGMTTKLVELTALAFILVPPRRGPAPRLRRVRRWAAVSTFLLITLLTGIGGWVALFAAEERNTQALAEDGGAAVGHGMVGMLMQPAGWSEPTGREQAAADRLVASTRDGIARYEQVDVAVADGYAISGPDFSGVVHYENKRYMDDGVTLDPTRPEMLVYGVVEDGSYRLGAVYAVAWPKTESPDAGGGSITAWHSHTNVCFGLAGLVGIVSPFGTCPALSVNVATGPMLHVWTVDLPGGPFGLEPERDDIERWLDGGAGPRKTGRREDGKDVVSTRLPVSPSISPPPVRNEKSRR